MKTGRPKGIKMSPETKEKLRQLALQRWQDPEYRERHLVFLTAACAKRCSARKAASKEKRPVGRPRGTKQPPEAIEKTRQATIRRLQNPEYRARQLANLMAARFKDVATSNAQRRIRPPKGTREHWLYEKIRQILGVEVARAQQW